MWLLAGVFALILFGILLLLLEILVVPGLVMGVIGVIFIVIGLAFTYFEYGATYGNYTVLATVFLTIMTVVFALRSKAWKKFGLQEEMLGRMNVLDTAGIQPGVAGKTVSALRPMGSVLIGDLKLEAESKGEFIDENIEIEVVKVTANKIIVKPK